MSNKKIIIIGIISLLALGGRFWGYKQTTQADNQLSQSNYVATFYKTLSAGPKAGIKSPDINRLGLIKRYCETIFAPDMIDGFPFDSDSTVDCKSIGSLCYSPKNSLFAALICERISNSYADKTNLKSDYLLFSSYNSLFERNDCLRSSNLNSCPISVYFSKIFHSIINDYTNSKIASIYGYTSKLSANSESDSKSILSSIKAFSDTYYEPCNDSSSSFNYINKDQIDGGATSSEAHCSHPNTYKVLSNYIENAKNKVANNVIVDYNKLLDSNAQGLLLYDAFARNCVGQAGAAELDCLVSDYQHLVMNELLFYGLFMKMYAAIIPSDKQFGALSLGKDAATTQEYLDEEAWKSQLELEVADESVYNTVKIVRNLYAQFPIHIGLVAYLEDLVNLRNELVKLYTPVHQMYYKLRNAQSYAR